jgi:hypothetical protein
VAGIAPLQPPFRLVEAHDNPRRLDSLIAHPAVTRSTCPATFYFHVVHGLALFLGWLRAQQTQEFLTIICATSFFSERPPC